MKEKAKLVKQHRERKVHQIGKRLGPEEAKGDDMEDEVNEAEKKRKLGGGQAQVVPNNPAARIQAAAIPK